MAVQFDDSCTSLHAPHDPKMLNHTPSCVGSLVQLHPVTTKHKHYYLFGLVFGTFHRLRVRYLGAHRKNQLQPSGDYLPGIGGHKQL